MTETNQIPKDHYRCAICGGVFRLNQDPEYMKQAKAEMERDFVGLKQEDAAIVCDDCYKKVCPQALPAEYAAYNARKN